MRKTLQTITFIGRWLCWAWWDAGEGIDDVRRGLDWGTRKKLSKRRKEKEPIPPWEKL